MGNRLTEAEALEVMRRVERGELTLTPQQEHDYSGIEVFTANDGTEIAVFNDCGEWDYCEWVRLPDGREWDYENGCSLDSPMANYQPPVEVMANAYQWPDGD